MILPDWSWDWRALEVVGVGGKWLSFGISIGQKKKKKKKKKKKGWGRGSPMFWTQFLSKDYQPYQFSY